MKLASTVQTRQGRYTLAATAPVRDDLGSPVGRSGWGADKNGSGALVFETGQAQQGVPVAAVVAAITDPKVTAPADLVAAFAEAGTLDKLAAAVNAATPPAS